MFTRIIQTLTHALNQDSTELHIPGPAGLPLIGHLLDLNHAKLHEQLYQYTVQYGDLVNLKLFDQQAILVSSPELLEQILHRDREHVYRNIYTKFYGKKLGWLDGALLGKSLLTHPCNMNTSASPFLASDFTALPASLLQLIQTRLTEWACSTSQAPITLYPRLVRLSFDALSHILFGELLPERFFRDFLTLSQGADFHSRTGIPSPAPNFWLAWTRWHNALSTHIKHAQQDPDQHPDSMLTQLLKRNPPLNKQVLVSELAAIYAGGTHPVASALMSVIYAFNKYQEAAEGVYAKAQLTRNSLEMCLNAAENDLPTLNHFICETLRLYPPVAVLARTVKPDRTVTLAGHKIPGNTQLLMSSWAMHRHPDYWENPLRFLPNRFDTAPRDYCYFPLGVGHHTCLGKQLALQLVRTLAWHLCHDTRILIDTRTPLLLQQSAGFLKPIHAWRAEVINRRASTVSNNTVQRDSRNERDAATPKCTAFTNNPEHSTTSPARTRTTNTNEEAI